MQPDAEIVRSVLLGNREAFAALVARHERAVWATSWRILRDVHTAADASQNAFLQAYRRLSDLRRPERFGFWVLRIARREALRLRRLRAREPNGSLDAADDARQRPRAPAGLPADMEALLEAIARLPEHERLVLAMHHLDGRPVAEVAAALGRPVGTVTKQLSRAIGRLRTTTKGVLG
jgi:RNA polymerase sigma-70 factor (ECF subfamily)